MIRTKTVFTLDTWVLGLFQPVQFLLQILGRKAHMQKELCNIDGLSINQRLHPTKVSKSKGEPANDKFGMT